MYGYLVRVSLYFLSDDSDIQKWLTRSRLVYLCFFCKNTSPVFVMLTPETMSGYCTPSDAKIDPTGSGFVSLIYPL